MAAAPPAEGAGLGRLQRRCLSCCPSARDARLHFNLLSCRAGAPPPEEWRGVDGTVSDIARALHLNANQHRPVLNVIVKTHHALLTGAEYDLMCKFRAGSIAIKSGSPEKQAAADYCERGLSYTETTLLIGSASRTGAPRSPAPPSAPAR